MIQKFNDFIEEARMFNKNEDAKRREKIKELFGIIFNFWKRGIEIKRDDIEELMSDCRFNDIYGMGEGTDVIVFITSFDDSDILSEFIGVDPKRRIARSYKRGGDAVEIKGDEFEDKFAKYYTRRIKNRSPEYKNRFDNINMWSDDHDNEFSKMLFC